MKIKLSLFLGPCRVVSAQIITALVLWELQLWLGKVGFPWQSGKTDLGQLKVGGRKEIVLVLPFPSVSPLRGCSQHVLISVW